ncbi:VOC family protein [Tomitella gaofuii]|uniref:VOC family protein n=1 Tax=Tomitella gaofuii TaxID=2760083 RepID=UPI0015FC3554|nr:VOC family protein [Tomitella gaofuii]
MARMIFPNLPVADVTKARDFWTALGFAFNENFSDDKAACLVINDFASVMLLRQDFFHGFHDTAPHSGTESILAFQALDRAEVDALCAKAADAGATHTDWRMEDGPMYAGAFRDPDGHLWEVLHMEM